MVSILYEHQLTDENLPLREKLRLAQEFAVENYHQKPGEVKMVGAVNTLPLERIAPPKRSNGAILG